MKGNRGSVKKISQIFLEFSGEQLTSVLKILSTYMNIFVSGVWITIQAIRDGNSGRDLASEVCCLKENVDKCQKILHSNLTSFKSSFLRKNDNIVSENRTWYCKTRFLNTVWIFHGNKCANVWEYGGVNMKYS